MNLLFTQAEKLFSKFIKLRGEFKNVDTEAIFIKTEMDYE